MQFASVRIRLKAFAFDYILIAGYIVILAGLTFVVVKISALMGTPLRWPEQPYIADLLAFTTLILPVIFYFSLQESSLKRATWGKRKTGISVIQSNGERISRKQAFTRSILKVVPWQIAHSCIFHMGGFKSGASTLSPVVIGGFALVYILVVYYFLSILFSKNHTAPYDKIPGTFVVINNDNS